MWDVAAKTSNASSIYVLRVVDTYGTNDEQKVGGFMSATFYVYGGSSSSSGTSSSAVTTSLASIASSDFTTSTGVYLLHSLGVQLPQILMLGCSI